MKKTIESVPLIPSVARKLGLDVHSDIAGRLRAHQIRQMMSTTPLMMVVITAIALIMFVFLSGRPGTWFLGYWTAGLCFVSTIGFLKSFRSNRRPKVHTASPSAPTKAVRGVLILGSMWGLVPAMLYPHADFQTKITIIGIIGGILGGGAMSLYVVPRALFTFLGAVCIGTIVGLALAGDSLDFALVALLSCYTIALMRAGWTLALTFAESVISTIQLNEKSETISVLLKDFSEEASDWLWEVDAEGNVVTGGEIFEKHIGFPFPSINAGKPSDERCHLIPENVRIKGLGEAWQCFKTREIFRNVVVHIKGGSHECWLSLSGKPVWNQNGEFMGFRGVASEITENKKSEERIAFLAHNDALTGLANRSNFGTSIDRQISHASGGANWAILYLDLDGFKLVNDRRGHGAGDDLLSQVAGRLKKSVGQGDVVARLGGDEFAILCVSKQSPQAVSAFAEDLIKNISGTYHLNDGALESGIGVSIGIAMGKVDGNTAHELLNNADLALYRSKSEGKGTYRFYEMEMDQIVKERRSLEHDLREALAKNQLTISYQPLVSAKTNRTTGFEALIRWNHPDRGAVPPAEFIPIAERIGIISEIGDWVLHEACRQATEWPDYLTVAVNLSPQQFHKQRIIPSVKSALAKSGLAAARLEMEITEGLFIENTEEVLVALNALKSLGVSIALDDFGTGYSSLSYLLKFPFDKLKIDRSFISQINEQDSVARNVLEAIAKLGKVLELKVTAEGVETLAQVEALKDLDCTHFQGFLFGKPLHSMNMPAYLLDEQARAIVDFTLGEKPVFPARAKQK